MILRLGALPLGTKHGWWPFRSSLVLNVGFVSPHRPVIREVKKTVADRKELGGIHVYRLDAAEFLTVLEHSYGVTRDKLLALPDSQVATALLETLKLPPASDDGTG